MTTEAPFLFYKLEGNATPTTDPDRSVQCWLPSGNHVRPLGYPLLPFAIWWLFHQLRIFRNRRYALLSVYESGSLVHRTCVFPGYFRFPFMARDDLQLGDIWTAPSMRGRGLAAMVLAECIRRFAYADCRLWYVVHRDNVASIRLAEKAGFTLHAQGERSPRFGVRLLGYYRITDYVTARTQIPPSRAA